MSRLGWGGTQGGGNRRMGGWRFHLRVNSTEGGLGLEVRSRKELGLIEL